MLWLLKKLIFGHVHAWERISGPVLIYRRESDNIPAGHRYVCTCKSCGHIRKFDV